MRVAQFSWSESGGSAVPAADGTDSVLVFFLGERQALACSARYHGSAGLEATSAEFRLRVPQLGFYLYVEISPHRGSGVCELHNQTMTVTTIAQAAGHAGA